MGITRVFTGDDRVLGILCADSPAGIVPLMNEDGAVSREVFSGEQCEVIGKKDGLVRVRTGFGDYLADRRYIRVINQAQPDSNKGEE